MKIILGDNQFFGVNHFDLEKGEKTKLKFDTTKKIETFINDSLEIGLNGFMINSNEKGYEIINTSKFDNTKEYITAFLIPISMQVWLMKMA